MGDMISLDWSFIEILIKDTLQFIKPKVKQRLVVVPKENIIERNIQTNITHKVNLKENQSKAFFEDIKLILIKQLKKKPRERLILKI